MTQKDPTSNVVILLADITLCILNRLSVLRLWDTDNFCVLCFIMMYDYADLIHFKTRICASQ